jgi:hypothetical protein
MSACRVARRVASMTRLQTAWMNAVNAPTLVRKVFHYLFQPFSSYAGRRPVANVEQRTMVGAAGGGRSSAGVRQGLRREGARRFVCWVTLVVTPVPTAALVTKEKPGGVA